MDWATVAMRTLLVAGVSILMLVLCILAFYSVLFYKMIRSAADVIAEEGPVGLMRRFNTSPSQGSESVATRRPENATSAAIGHSPVERFNNLLRDADVRGFDLDGWVVRYGGRDVGQLNFEGLLTGGAQVFVEFWDNSACAQFVAQIYDRWDQTRREREFRARRLGVLTPQQIRDLVRRVPSKR